MCVALALSRSGCKVQREIPRLTITSIFRDWACVSFNMCTLSAHADREICPGLPNVLCSPTPCCILKLTTAGNRPENVFFLLVLASLCVVLLLLMPSTQTPHPTPVQIQIQVKLPQFHQASQLLFCTNIISLLDKWSAYANFRMVHTLYLKLSVMFPTVSPTLTLLIVLERVRVTA